MKYKVFIFALFISISTFSQHSLQLFLNDGTEINSFTEQYLTAKIIKSKGITSIDKNKVNTNFSIDKIKSFIIDKIDCYEVLKIDKELLFAQLIVEGDKKLYLTQKNSKDESYLLYDSIENKMIYLNNSNLSGAFNYYFKDCKNFNDFNKNKINLKEKNLVNAFDKYYECTKKPYSVKSRNEQPTVYLNLFSGANFYNLQFAKDLAIFITKAKYNLKPGYFIGGNIEFEFKNRVSIVINVIYHQKNSTSSAEYVQDQFLRDVVKGTGRAKTKSIEFPINVKYYLLDKKVSPYIQGGLTLQYKLSQNIRSIYSSTYQPITRTVDVSDFSKIALGFNFGIGLRYKIIDALSVFGETGYTFSISRNNSDISGIPSWYYTTENTINLQLGFGIKLNKYKK